MFGFLVKLGVYISVVTGMLDPLFYVCVISKDKTSDSASRNEKHYITKLQCSNWCFYCKLRILNSACGTIPNAAFVPSRLADVKKVVWRLLRELCGLHGANLAQKKYSFKHLWFSFVSGPLSNNHGRACSKPSQTWGRAHFSPSLHQWDLDKVAAGMDRVMKIEEREWETEPERENKLCRERGKRDNKEEKAISGTKKKKREEDCLKRELQNQRGTGMGNRQGVDRVIHIKF